MKSNQYFSCQIAIQVQSIRFTSPVNSVFYLEYAVTDTKIIEIGSDNQVFNHDTILVNQYKLLDFSLSRQVLEESYLNFTLFAKNEVSNLNQRRRDQIVGKLILPILSIMTGKQVGMKEYSFIQSSLDAIIKVKCLPLQNISYSPQKTVNKKQRLLAESILEDHTSSPGKQLSQNQSLSSSRAKRQTHSHSWEQILAHQASFYTDNNQLTKIQSNQILQQRIKQMQRIDLEAILKDNYRLQRLLYIARNQRKIQNKRQQQELKDIARQLSLKEAELLKLREDLDNANEKIAQLLEESGYLTCQNEQLIQIAENEKKINQKLNMSHDLLSARIEKMSEQKQIITCLGFQMENLKIKIQEKDQKIQVLTQNLQSLQVVNQQLQTEVKKLSQLCQKQEEELRIQAEVGEICRKYESKISELEEKIDSIDDQQFLHSTTYSSRGNSNKIKIEDQDCNSLRQIVQEQLQESLSLQGDTAHFDCTKSNDIFTATTLFDPHQRNEYQLLQLLTKNLQQDHNRLKQLYNQQQIIISQNQLDYKNLQKSISQMRYEFLIELSQVTALMNQQILQNRELQEVITQLKASSEENKQPKISQSRVTPFFTPTQQLELKEQIAASSFECLKYEAKCRQLEADNQALLRYNLQREQLYEITFAKQNGEIRKLSELNIDQQRYNNILSKYKITLKSNNGISLNNHEVLFSQRQMIKQNNMAKSELVSEVNKLDQFQNNCQLLLQSESNQNTSSNHVLANLVHELSDLYDRRQKVAKILNEPLSNQYVFDNLEEIKKQVIKIKKQLMQQKLFRNNSKLFSMFLQLQKKINLIY